MTMEQAVGARLSSADDDATTTSPASRPDPPPAQLREQLCNFLLCPLCQGYLIDATVASECGHAFCKSCITTYISNIKPQQKCPVCDAVLNPEYPELPLKGLRSDHRRQRIVYKLVPGLFEEEIRQRMVFAGSTSSDVHDKMRGETMGKLVSHGGAFYANGEYCNIILNPTTVQQQPEEAASSWTRLHEVYIMTQLKTDVKSLKKFIQLKFHLEQWQTVQIVCDNNNNNNYTDDLTLLEIAYEIKWNRAHPMRLTFCVPKSENKIAFVAAEPVPTETEQHFDDSKNTVEISRMPPPTTTTKKRQKTDSSQTSQDEERIIVVDDDDDDEEEEQPTRISPIKISLKRPAQLQPPTVVLASECLKQATKRQPPVIASSKKQKMDTIHLNAYPNVMGATPRAHNSQVSTISNGTTTPSDNNNNNSEKLTVKLRKVDGGVWLSADEHKKSTRKPAALSAGRPLVKMPSVTLTPTDNFRHFEPAAATSVIKETLSSSSSFFPTKNAHGSPDATLPIIAGDFIKFNTTLSNGITGGAAVAVQQSGQTTTTPTATSFRKTLGTALSPSSSLTDDGYQNALYKNPSPASVSFSIDALTSSIAPPPSSSSAFTLFNAFRASRLSMLNNNNSNNSNTQQVQTSFFGASNARFNAACIQQQQQNAATTTNQQDDASRKCTAFTPGTVQAAVGSNKFFAKTIGLERIISRISSTHKIGNRSSNG